MGFRMILDLESLDASVPSRRHFLSSEERKFVQSGTHDLCGLFAGQGCDNEFSDILAKPALSIEQAHFLKVCAGNKWHETNTISRDRGYELADDRHATSAFNSRDDAQCVSAFLDDH